jgi:hypothetical protein
MRAFRTLGAVAGLALAAAVMAPAAQAGDLSIGFSISVPPAVIVAPPPIYYAPPPAYYVQPGYVPGYYAGPGYYYPIRRHGPPPGYGYRGWHRHHFDE